MRPARFFVAALLLLVPLPEASAQKLIERCTIKELKFRVERVALSPGGKILAAGGGDSLGGELKLWDTATSQEIASLPGYTGSLYSLAFSPDGKRLASGRHDRVQLWDVNAHKEIASFTGFFQVNVVALNREGTRLATEDLERVKLWEVATRKELASFQPHVPVYGGPVAAFRRDLALLAVRNYQDIDLWDTATGKEKTPLSEHRGEVGCLVWSATTRP